MSCIITYKGNRYTQEQFKEYISSNKNEFSRIIASNKNVIESFKRKMEGIDFVFSQSPELASIGSKAQYLQYLSTIFKTSKVKDIVYHGGEKTFEQFSLETGNRASGTSQIKKGIYFTNKKNVAKTYVYSKETATIKAFNSIISSMEYSLGIKKLTKEEEMYGVDIPTKASDTIKKAEKEYNTTFKGIVNDFNSIRYDDNTYYSIAGNIDLSKVDGELLLSYLRNDNIEGVKSLYENYIKENKPSEKLYSVLINLINPTTLNNNGKPTSIYHILNQNIDKANNAQSLIINDVNDQVKSVFKEITDTDSEITYVVFDPEQIHILGSRKDIEGFKEFVDKNNINQDLQNLNLTTPVLESLYENSSKSKDFITFVKDLKKMIAIWQNSGRTNEEILEMIKCL